MVTFEEVYDLQKCMPPRPAGGFPRGSEGDKLSWKLECLCRRYFNDHSHTFWAEYYHRVELGTINLAL